MDEERYNLTIYEIIAVQVLTLFYEMTGKRCLNRDIIWSDEKLTACILEAVEWYEKADSAENGDHLLKLYIKKVNEKYLDVVQSKAFLSSYSDDFRRCLTDHCKK